MNELLNLLGNLQIHQKPLKYSVPKEKAPDCEKKRFYENIRTVCLVHHKNISMFSDHIFATYLLLICFLASFYE